MAIVPDLSGNNPGNPDTNLWDGIDTHHPTTRELVQAAATAQAESGGYPEAVREIITGATHTIVEENHGKVLVFTNAGGCVVTMPSIFDGFVCGLYSDTPGDVVINAGVGMVRINRFTHTKLAAQYAEGTLRQHGTNAFILRGDTA